MDPHPGPQNKRIGIYIKDLLTTQTRESLTNGEVDKIHLETTKGEPAQYHMALTKRTQRHVAADTKAEKAAELEARKRKFAQLHQEEEESDKRKEDKKSKRKRKSSSPKRNTNTLFRRTKKKRKEPREE